MDVFIGRQPIFSLQEKIIAYELLYRSKNVSHSVIGEADDATIDVLVNSLLNIGIEKVANGHPCFVNFTENLLLSNIAEYLNPNQIVIEILEDVSITPNIINRVKELKALGFKIALDDFILDDNVDMYYELFMIIDYLKVDFLLSPLGKCIEINRTVKAKFTHIKLLAEKVETREQLAIAQRAGYEMFQGYFFEKPQVITSVDIPSNSMQYFEIMSLLNDEEPDINELSKLIERDISLSYKILQQSNTSTLASKNSVGSIKQAIARIGFNELRKWIYLLALRGSKDEQNMDAFLELMSSSLYRAKVCEKLAKKTGRVNHSECFLVGMFSLIDTLLQRSMADILQQLPLSDVVLATILGEKTDFTLYLELSVSLSRMDLSHVEVLLEYLGIDSIDIEQLHGEALEWAESAVLSQKKNEQVVSLM